jgi:hypothetical protein
VIYHTSQAAISHAISHGGLRGNLEELWGNSGDALLISRATEAGRCFPVRLLWEKPGGEARGETRAHTYTFHNLGTGVRISQSACRCLARCGSSESGFLLTEEWWAEPTLPLAPGPWPRSEEWGVRAIESESVSGALLAGWSCDMLVSSGCTECREPRSRLVGGYRISQVLWP